jgi:hypothetical protein
MPPPPMLIMPGFAPLAAEKIFFRIDRNGLGYLGSYKILNASMTVVQVKTRHHMPCFLHRRRNICEPKRNLIILAPPGAISRDN